MERMKLFFFVARVVVILVYIYIYIYAECRPASKRLLARVWRLLSF